MENILEIKGLTKKFKDVGIEDITFNVPKGSIVGLIGRNGAGKTTLIKTILDITKKDFGEVKIFGESVLKDNLKNDIGVVFDGETFPYNLTPTQINNIFKSIYINWDEKKFFDKLNEMEIPLKKKVKDFSKGMKMKVSILVSLCHNAKFLILDEATSGLDPVARDEILDLFLDFIQDEERGILVSSHITSDLEKVADYISFIDKGKIVFFENKDKIIYEYGILRVSEDQKNKLDKNIIVKKIKRSYGYDVLVNNKTKVSEKYPDLTIDSCSIDELMVIYTKGGN